MTERQEAIIKALAETVAGLQVPMSMGVPLGAAQRGYNDLADLLWGFGWQTAEDITAMLMKEFE